jgi:hypothetical protein
MKPARSTAAAGLLYLVCILPALAQTTGPGDSGTQNSDQVERAEPANPSPGRIHPPRDSRGEPPARADDGFELPPPTGCRFRENKLDLIV